MRSVNLTVNEDEKITSYNFFRTMGDDDGCATYILVSNDDGGIIPIIKFEGTMEHNAQKLLEYFHSQTRIKIIKVTGDEELGNYMKMLIMNSEKK